MKIGEKLSSVSFFCPAYHDEKNLPKLIPKVAKFLQEITNKYEIIIVEDGSPDKTGEVADFLAKKFKNVRVIHHEKNMGYGGALKDGFENAKYDYVMYTDGDNQYDVNEFKRAISLLKDADVVSGYAKKKAVNFRRKLQSIVFNTAVMALFSIYIKDINCSMKIYKMRVLKNINIKSFSAFIDAEMIIKAKRNGFKIAQFPVTHYPRSNGIEGGSKISVIMPTVKDMIKFGLGLL